MQSPPHKRVALASGSFGTDQTVNTMAKMAMGEYGAGSLKIRDKAIDIIHAAGVNEKDTMGEISAIHDWVKSHLHYIKDPIDVEFVTYPETLAFVKPYGDCDDHVILESALLGALGIPSRFVTVGTGPFGMNHVYMEALITKSAKWIPLDPIMKDKPVGWSVPDAKRIKKYPINSARGLGVGGLPNMLMLGFLTMAGKKVMSRIGWI